MFSILILIWWVEHEQSFPNISHITQHFMIIVDSQIETERIFNMVGVIIGLKHF
jgi:hypothetical protein